LYRFQLTHSIYSKIRTTAAHAHAKGRVFKPTFIIFSGVVQKNGD
jgi:hypothetical protein